MGYWDIPPFPLISVARAGGVSKGHNINWEVNLPIYHSFQAKPPEVVWWVTEIYHHFPWYLWLGQVGFCVFTRHRWGFLKNPDPQIRQRNDLSSNTGSPWNHCKGIPVSPDSQGWCNPWFSPNAVCRLASCSPGWQNLTWLWINTYTYHF